MRDEAQTEDQPIRELAELRQRITELEASEAEWKQVEEAFRESSRLNQAIVDTAPYLIYIYDLAERSDLYMNHQLSTLLGYTSEAFQKMGGRIDTLTPPEDYKLLREHMDKLAADRDGGTFEVAYRMKRADGAWCWLRSRDVVFKRTADGLPQQILGTAVDITERKQSEEQVHFQKTLLECQSEAALDGILVVSDDRTWLYFNQRFIEMWGVPEHIVKTQSSRLAVQWARDRLTDPEPFIAKIEYLYEHRDEESLDETTLLDGRVFQYYSAPVKSPAGVYYGRVWYYRDITERVQAEKALQKAHDELERRVQQRTADLRTVNESLRREIYERVQAEDALQEANDKLEQRVSQRTTELTKANALLREKVAERQKAEKELRESETRLAGILDIAKEAIVSINELQDIIIFNTGAEEVFNYSQDEIIGKSIDLLVPEEFRDLHHRHIAEFIRSPATSRLVGERQGIFGRRKNGEIFPAEASISKLILDGQTILTAILRDITDRKQAEEALGNALNEVEQLKNQLQAENIYLQEEIKLQHNFAQIISRSDAFKQVLYQVEQVAKTDATVLILGETGTGKELIARAVHTISNRNDRPLVKVNCAAVPESLIESELFGHEKGAFTGALSRQIGRFELADKGTIFLDEIGDLPLDLQAKLLRILQEGEFERLGNSRTIQVDVRVIAATNRDLEKTVKAGNFREDLYYRLNVFPIFLPPLRERKEDIPLLVTHFVKKYSTKLGKKIGTIPQPVIDALNTYRWPGNVRELENIIERSVILAPGAVLRLDETLAGFQNTGLQATHGDTLEDVERNHILKILEQTHWVVSGKHGAARILGLHPNTLRSRMKKRGIKRP